MQFGTSLLRAGRSAQRLFQEARFCPILTLSAFMGTWLMHLAIRKSRFSTRSAVESEYSLVFPTDHNFPHRLNLILRRYPFKLSGKSMRTMPSLKRRQPPFGRRLYSSHVV